MSHSCFAAFLSLVPVPLSMPAVTGTVHFPSLPRRRLPTPPAVHEPIVGGTDRAAERNESIRTQLVAVAERQRQRETEIDPTVPKTNQTQSNPIDSTRTTRTARILIPRKTLTTTWLLLLFLVVAHCHTEWACTGKEWMDASDIDPSIDPNGMARRGTPYNIFITVKHNRTFTNNFLERSFNLFL